MLNPFDIFATVAGEMPFFLCRFTRVMSRSISSS
jgi:hypothetical protein